MKKFCSPKKKLAMQKSLYEAEVELPNISMSQNLNDYNKAMLAKDIIAFQQDGITDSEEFLRYAKERMRVQSQTSHLN